MHGQCYLALHSQANEHALLATCETASFFHLLMEVLRTYSDVTNVQSSHLLVTKYTVFTGWYNKNAQITFNYSEQSIIISLIQHLSRCPFQYKPRSAYFGIIKRVHIYKRNPSFEMNFKHKYFLCVYLPVSITLKAMH